MDNNIQHFRKGKKVTQEQLAKVAGVSRQTINAIELGKYSPSLKLALKISKFFNKKVEEVFLYW